MPTTPQPAPSVKCVEGHLTEIKGAKPLSCPQCGSTELRVLESRRIRD